MSRLTEVKITRETGKYNELGTRIDELKPTKIIWGVSRHRRNDRQRR